MRIGIIALSFAASFCAASLHAAPSVELELTAGDYDRDQTPITFLLPKKLAEFQHFKLVRAADKQEIAAQRYPGKTAKIGWVLARPLDKGETRQYRLTAQEQVPLSAGASCVSVEDDGRSLLVNVGERPALRYNYEVNEGPKGMDPIYRRSGYIHPLFTPSGRELTGDFPADHPHQHAVFFAWTNTSLDGRPLNFWDQKGRTGRIEHVKLEGERERGPVFAQFGARLRHLDITTPESPQPVLNENWVVRVYNTKGYFLVDLYSRQRNTSVWPLVINKYHYGAMAIRGNDQWFGKPNTLGDFLTSEGKGREDGNATRARWVEMHGDLDGKPAGVAIMGHPKNFRAPQPVRLHPSKPYFCFAPMALGEFEIKPDETYVSQFRFYLHDGPVDAKESERLWNDYANPPKAVIVKP